jgi:hypothetical protein
MMDVPFMFCIPSLSVCYELTVLTMTVGLL